MKAIKTMLRDGLSVRRSTASGRKGATRWEVWNGEADYDHPEKYLGDLVRFMPEAEWVWQPYPDGEEVSGCDPYEVTRTAGLAPREA